MKISFAFLLLFFCGLMACHHPKTESLAKPFKHENQQLLEKTICNLRDCDLVLRRGKDATSYIFSQINAHDKTFSHCGIVMIENDKPFIYHAIGGEENPNCELRKEAPKNWFSPLSNQAIGIARFKLNDEERARLKKIVVRYFNQKIKFDKHFDLSTNDRFYCSEFVYKSLNETFGTDTVFSLVRKMGHIYIPVESLYKNARTKLVWQVWFK